MINAFFFIFGFVFAITLAVSFSKQQVVGEVQVDREKEILQMVFDSEDKLTKAVNSKKVISFKVTHKSLDWQYPQKKQGL